MNKLFWAALISILTCAIFIVDLKTELGIAGGVLYISVIALCLLTKDKRFFIVLGISGVSLTVLGYFLSPLGGEENKILLNRLYAIFSISITAVLGYIISANQERLEIITNNIDELVSFADKDAHYRYANKTYVKWLGIPHEKIINKPIEQVLGNHLYEKLKPYIFEALNGKPQNFEIEFPEGKVTRKYARVQYFPKINLFGNVEGLFAIITDLTAHKQNEALIKEEKQRLATILNSIPIQIWVLNEVGEIKFFNTACEDIILQLSNSYSRTNLNGINITDLYSNIWRKEDNETLKNHINQKTKHFVFEYFLDFPTGRRHFLILGNNLKMAGFDGNFVLTHIDITQRIKAEEEVTRTKIQLEGILDNSPAIIYMKDMTGRYLMINKHCEEILKVNRKDLIGKTAHEAFPKALADQFVKNDNRIMNTLESQEVEETIWDPVTGKKTLLSIQFPLRLENGNPYAICGISRDITRRKKDYDLLQKTKTGLEGEIKEHTLELIRKNEALEKEVENHKFTQKQLAKSEERFKFALEVSSDGIWDWNMKTDEVYFSPGWIESLGYQPQDVGNGLNFWKSIVHPDDMEKVTEQLQKHVNGETDSYTCENRLLTKSGQWRWNLDQGKIVQWDDKGKPVRMIGTDTNINQSKIAELKLQDTQRQLIHMEKLSALGKLTGTIAHEFNNPIYAIQLILEQLNDEVSLSGSPHKGIQIAIKECQRVSSLITRLKDFYIPSTGELKSTSFDTLIEETLLLLSATLRKNNINLTIDLSKPSKKILVVEDQIKQVLLNILKNSIESIPIESKNREVKITTWYTKDEACLSIKDTGVGIANDFIESISEPFVSMKSSEKGSGLGLSISYRIIDEHDGRIEVSSELGVGSNFIIVLPVEKTL
ncbi:MAG: PAS domain S-box protein [Nitrospinae bacterium]|nr:PAS domain S-box protein [Nitrospinota bacterium]